MKTPYDNLIKKLKNKEDLLIPTKTGVLKIEWDSYSCGWALRYV